MERDAYRLLQALEADHWWFAGRRQVIEAALRFASLPADARILDAGCGSGGNLPMLTRHGTVWGFERDPEARTLAVERQIATVAPGSLPGEIPFAPMTYDAIGLFDVLEHLEHPVESLRALRARLSPQGVVVLTVPAHPWLWGAHDVVHAHQRRYTPRALRAHLEAGGLRVERLTYTNALLFPLAVAQRMREALFGYRPEALEVPRPLNALFTRCWAIEARWIPRHRLPMGLSLLAVARAS